MNIEDPAVSRLLAESLQWTPLRDKQVVLEKVPALTSIEELQALLAELKGGSGTDSDFRKAGRAAGRALAEALLDNEA